MIYANSKNFIGFRNQSTFTPNRSEKFDFSKKSAMGFKLKPLEKRLSKRMECIPSARAEDANEQSLSPQLREYITSIIEPIKKDIEQIKNRPSENASFTFPYLAVLGTVLSVSLVYLGLTSQIASATKESREANTMTLKEAREANTAAINRSNDQFTALSNLLSKESAERQIEFNKLNSKIDGNYNELSSKIDTKYGELSSKIDSKYGELSSKIDTKYGELSSKIDSKYGELSSKIDTKYGELSSKMDGLEKKIDQKRGIFF